MLRFFDMRSKLYDHEEKPAILTTQNFSFFVIARNSFWKLIRLKGAVRSGQVRLTVLYNCLVEPFFKQPTYLLQYGNSSLFEKITIFSTCTHIIGHKKDLLKILSSSFHTQVFSDIPSSPFRKIKNPRYFTFFVLYLLSLTQSGS